MASTELRRETDAQVFVPPEWMNQVVGMEERFCREIRNVDARAAVSNLVDSSSVGYRLIEPYLKRYERPKILEIGTGYGFGLCYLKKRGLNATGIEPGNSAGFEGRYDQAIELLEANGIEDARQSLHPAFGESLPFADRTFDIVYSIDVLEHVRDIEKCLTEALRVAKPGATVIMVVPSYNSFHEGHYDVLWLPHLLKSKRVAKWYVRTVFKRRDWFIDELNFTTPSFFKKLTEKRAEFKGMKLYLTVDPHIPIMRKIFGLVADRYYRLRDESSTRELSFKRRLLLKTAGIVLDVGEFFGMVLVCRMVWEPPEQS